MMCMRGVLTPCSAMTFEQFLNNVIDAAVRLLLYDDPKLKKILKGPLNQVGHAWKRYSKNWKSLYLYREAEIFYRIGKTTPRKGPHQGQMLLVMELVMDGKKKQAFIPMLEYKQEIEEKVGSALERGQPGAEVVGNYRFRLFFPYEQVYNEEVEVVAKKFYQFVGATRPLLNGCGIN